MTEKRLILYVDDEPDIRLIVEMSLKIHQQFDVHTAASGQEALDMLRGKRLTPDAIMVDVMMPGLTGPDVLTMLQADPETSIIPVIFVTARARPQDIDDYVAQGARGVITKPFDPMALAGQVASLIQ